MVDPVHVSATSQLPAVARHVVPAFPAAWTQAGDPTVPLHLSVVHTLPSSVQADPEAFTVSVGHVELPPVQVSALSHSFAAARQIAPAFPALWTHAAAPTVPLQRSVEQALPSSVQAVPALFTTSAGHVVLLPVQFSARSHSLVAARQTVLDGSNPSAGQVVDDPVHVSTASQTPTAARQVVPAFPAL